MAGRGCVSNLSWRFQLFYTRICLSKICLGDRSRRKTLSEHVCVFLLQMLRGAFPIHLDASNGLMPGRVYRKSLPGLSQSSAYSYSKFVKESLPSLKYIAIAASKCLADVSNISCQGSFRKVIA